MYIIIFRKGMTADVLSHYVDVTNDTKQCFVMPPVLFVLFFTVMIKYTVSDMDTGVIFQSETGRCLFNYQRFKSKTIHQTNVIRNFLFIDAQVPNVFLLHPHVLPYH